VGLRDEIDAEHQRWTRPRVRAALGDDADEFDRLLDDPEVPVMGLHRALKRRGINVTDRTLYYWRRNR